LDIITDTTDKTSTALMIPRQLV